MNPEPAADSPDSQDITSRNPQDLLKPDSLEQYKALHEDIWHRLVHVRTNITILEKIFEYEYPLSNLYAPQENVFWTMVFWNFTDMSVILLHTLVSDNTKGAHTLLRFKNNVLSWIKDQYKPAYRNKLRQIRLTSQLDPIRDKVAEMRNKVIAHRLLDSNGARVIHVEGVTLDQVRQVYEDIEKLFRACSFGAEYVTTLYPESTVGGKPVEMDIEQLLALLVKKSDWLKQPEQRAPYWQMQKQGMSPADLEDLNTWRRKYDLPDA